MHAPRQCVLGISSYLKATGLHPTKFYCLIAILDTIAFFVVMQRPSHPPPPRCDRRPSSDYYTVAIVCAAHNGRLHVRVAVIRALYVTRGQYSTVFVSLPTFIKVVSMPCLWPRVISDTRLAFCAFISGGRREPGDEVSRDCTHHVAVGKYL